MILTIWKNGSVWLMNRGKKISLKKIHQLINYRSRSSTSWIFVALRSDASDVGVGGYSITTRSGRFIRRMQGSQYRNTILTCISSSIICACGESIYFFVCEIINYFRFFFIIRMRSEVECMIDRYDIYYWVGIFDILFWKRIKKIKM